MPIFADLMQVKLSGQARLIRELGLVDRDARLAHKSAIRAAGTKARALARRKVAGRYGIPQKVLKERIKVYPFMQDGLENRRVWGGLKNSPRAEEHPRVARAILADSPGAFWAPINGRRRLMVRRQPTRPYGPGARQPEAQRPRGALPIANARLRNYRETLRAALLGAAFQAMRETYVKRIIADFRRRRARRRR